MPVSLLVVEDNEDILYNLYAFLEPLGYVLDCARNGNAALKMALENRFDCMLLDLLLPGLDGYTVCRKLREAGSTIPIIMLTALDAESNRVAGLDAGADDYLAKPFSLRELEARIRAILRRGANMGGNSGNFAFADLELNTNLHRARRQGRELRLSPSAFCVLAELVRAAPGLVSRQRLEEALWGDDPPGGSALRNHILEIRKELDKPFATSLLETVPHVGYRLVSPGEASSNGE